MRNASPSTSPSMIDRPSARSPHGTSSPSTPPRRPLPPPPQPARRHTPPAPGTASRSPSVSRTTHTPSRPASSCSSCASGWTTPTPAPSTRIPALPLRSRILPGLGASGGTTTRGRTIALDSGSRAIAGLRPGTVWAGQGDKPTRNRPAHNNHPAAPNPPRACAGAVCPLRAVHHFATPVAAAGHEVVPTSITSERIPTHPTPAGSVCSPTHRRPTRLPVSRCPCRHSMSSSPRRTTTLLITNIAPRIMAATIGGRTRTSLPRQRSTPSASPSTVPRVIIGGQPASAYSYTSPAGLGVERCGRGAEGEFQRAEGADERQRRRDGDERE
ncbi:hypothetical protein BV22DRAFT_325236 [Leucogyrophana mollusca]|uniref:Uncharacterized protein n=1 Tax=Leucogyrophana mollusca TaxID=85980 RepID=A0ACB8BQJ4_9AGAM|nr:hypothetical protein BV22DRAFT_325236 [Leucogyrophana mollusca]